MVMGVYLIFLMTAGRTLCLVSGMVEKPKKIPHLLNISGSGNFVQQSAMTAPSSADVMATAMSDIALLDSSLIQCW
jgi:hypothetical protein